MKTLRFTGPGLVILIALTVVLAQDKKDDPNADLNHIPADGTFFATVRFGELRKKDAVKDVVDNITKEAPDVVTHIEKTLGVKPDEIDRITVLILDPPPSSEPIILIKANKTIDEAALTKTVGKLTKKPLNGRAVFMSGTQTTFCLLSDKVYAMGPLNEIQALLDRVDKKADGPLRPAIELAQGKSQVVAGVNVAAIVKKVPAEQLAVPLPFQALLKAQILTVAGDLDAKGAKAEARLHFATAEDAKGAEQSAKAGLELSRAALPPLIEQLTKAKETPPFVLDLARKADEGLKEAKLILNGPALELTGGIKMDVKSMALGMADVVQMVRESAGRAQSQNNLKQIGIAIHNYHSTYNNIPPPAIISKEGKPLLSWRVIVLPYIEQEALYKEFHLDEPWDSDHNKKLLEKMPKTYMTPTAKPGTTDTVYLGFAGKDTVFPGRKGISLFHIADGTSNTVMVAEAAKGVPWTKPEDITVDNNKLLPRLGGVYKGGFNTLFGDGSVRFIPSTITEEILHMLITPSGGEVIPNF